MRWLVEVITLGKTEIESLLVDAESWQKALQNARLARGEAAPMSGFSIELLDNGCRAIDPKSRIRYDVRRAPEGASGAVAPSPATVARTSPEAAEGPAAKIPAPDRASPSVAPRGSKPPRASKRPGAPASPDGAVETGAAIEPGAAGGGPAPTGVPTPAKSMPSIAPAAAGTSVATRAEVGSNVPSQVIFKREHDATDSVPLTYREYVFLVPSGTTEEAAEGLIRYQLELVRGSLARVPPGKLVNLAVFDVAFRGKPPLPPLTTLMWKDWRGLATVAFPRRSGSVPPPGASAAAPTAPARTVDAPAAPITPVRTDAPAPQSSRQTTPPARSTVPPPPAVAASPATTAPAAPASAPRVRVRGEELIADLFESMHELQFLRDSIEGGEFCLHLAMDKIPSQAGIVHLYDIDRREFIVTSTRGPAARKLLLRRHPEGDAILAFAMGKRRATVFVDASRSDAASIDRYVTLGGARSLMVAPVMQSGRFLGAIELLNPLDGQPYTEAEGNALTYIADRFAEFVASRGVVTDPARISSRAG